MACGASSYMKWPPHFFSRNLRGPVLLSIPRFLACGGDTPASPDQVMRPGMPLHSRPLLSSRTGEDYSIATCSMMRAILTIRIPRVADGESQEDHVVARPNLPDRHRQTLSDRGRV